jgi:DNA-binding response OmpR family regulator
MGPLGCRTARFPSSSELVSEARGRSGLGGMRVLIAEDESLVGIQLEEDLRSAGCSILGPFSTLELTTQASRRERFDLAILDINLNGEMVYPLAEELSARGVPFIFLSGYISADLPKRFREAPRIMKPHDPAVLIEEIQKAVPKGN